MGRLGKLLASPCACARPADARTRRPATHVARMTGRLRRLLSQQHDFTQNRVPLRANEQSFRLTQSLAVAAIPNPFWYFPPAPTHRPGGPILNDQHKGWSIRIRLMLIALAVALPFLLLSAGIVWHLAENERETRREAILFSTRALMNTVDAMLNRHIAVAQMLSTSPALLTDDLAAFRAEAERALPALAGGWAVV